MIHVTSTACNAGKLAYHCIRSVAEQTYTEWRMHFFDAASTDDTVGEALTSARDSHGQATVHTENTRTGIFDKLLPLWRSFKDEDIIVWLDGDDALANPYALKTVQLAHDAGALVTYGQFMWGDGTLGFAAPVGSRPRKEPWRATHLKTFRAGLVKQIKDEDLRDARGDYFYYCTDQCVMLPLLEMAPERSVFIPKILHLYNGARGTQTQEQMKRETEDLMLIRNRPAYDKSTVGVSGAW